MDGQEYARSQVTAILPCLFPCLLENRMKTTIKLVAMITVYLQFSQGLNVLDCSIPSCILVSAFGFCCLHGSGRQGSVCSPVWQICSSWKRVGLLIMNKDSLSDHLG